MACADDIIVKIVNTPPSKICLLFSILIIINKTDTDRIEKTLKVY